MGFLTRWMSLVSHKLLPTADIHTIYVALGEAVELPCPSPPTLHGDEFLSWFRSLATGSSTALVARVQVASPAPDSGKPHRESRLKLLRNHSLWLEGSKEGDAGQYWCAMEGQRHTYHNWRVYDVSVFRGECGVCRPEAPGSQGSPEPELRIPFSLQDPSTPRGPQTDPPALSSCALWSPPDAWTL